MSEQAVNPGRGTAPNGQPIMNEAEAALAVDRMLNPTADNQRPRKRTQEVTQQAEPQGEAEPELTGEAEGEPEGAPEEIEEPESEQPADELDDGSPELPERLAELSEALEMEPDALLALKVPVNIDGKVGEVTLSEAISGYQKDQDYRRKTEALSQERQSFQANVQQAQAAFQQKTQVIDTMIEALRGELAMGPSEEDLVHLINEGNTAEYLRQKASIDAKRGRLQQFQQQRAQQMQQETQEQLHNIARYRQSQQQALLAKYPGIDNPAEGAKLQAQVEQILGEFGFSKEELTHYMQGPWDHRMIDLALKYNTLRQMQKNGKDAVKKIALKPKITKPGSPKQSKGQTERRQTLRDKLRTARNRNRRGATERDAAAYVQSLLE